MTERLNELQELAADPNNQTDYTEQIRAEQERVEELRAGALRQGMDIQGGVHLVIEIDMEKFVDTLEQQGMGSEEIEYAKETVLFSASEIVENRVDQFGVAEAAIMRQEPNRIILEMPGFSDPQRVADLVQAEAQLSFHLVQPDEQLAILIEDIDTYATEDFQGLLMDTLPMPDAAVVAVDERNVPIVQGILAREEIKSLVPRDSILQWSEVQEASQYINNTHRYLYLLKAKPEVTGAQLETAAVYFDPATGKPQVSLSFNSDGAILFRRTTEQNIGRQLAVVMDERVFSAPRLNEVIPNGRAVITGIDGFEEARQIAVVLRAGALPAPLEIVESRVVGPSLGIDSVQQSVWAGIIGGIIVIIAVCVYYSVCGIVACLAMLMNLVLLVAGLALFQATLTLPGIAGILLTIGMAIDANVLIYERMREEMQGKRTKSVPLILEKSYSRAFMTIFDSNLTTLITALVLFQFGTGPIKGFAVTLSLGIIISMFTAVFVTRVIFDVMEAKGWMKELRVGTYTAFANANYNFIGVGRKFAIASFVIGFIGFFALVFTWENHKGIDFSGGIEVLLHFEEPISVDDVRDGLATQGLAEATIQDVLGEENQILVRVADNIVANADELQAEVSEALPNYQFEILRSDSVSAKVGSELLWQAFYCLLFASLGILLYITARFEFRFAVASVLALFHDLLLTLSFLWIWGAEFNLPIVAALLTVLGYSLNDTIVVFDRIRENYTSAIKNFPQVVNESINQTLSRTIITALSTMVILMMLFVFGGAVLRDFSLTLFMGIVIGTFSSIFVASPILLMMGHHPPTPARVATPEKKKSREAEEVSVSV
ncbi:MAG: protein translocase subunit SecD [bacterium]